QFCAYHNAVQDASGNYVYYGVHPDMSTGGCSRGCGPNANYLDNQTAVMSHELIEAVTDPIDNHPWVDQSQSCREIRDILALGAGEDDVIKGYYVQKEWSNKYSSCIAVAPGASKGCTKDGDCTAPTAHCGTTGANLGNCVACVTNDHCSGATPVCDQTSNTCR